MLRLNILNLLWIRFYNYLVCLQIVTYKKRFSLLS